ncbi:hypothetical protein HK100_002336 [Physocladia obscura]|uniref:Cryptic loci regulator 2 N-terminal domain-containing protein n=1 Tax=Physocladia obscura TaxID=109957 RepID=A0AAD5XFI0_9FUNG|nr:hypothetical protein HK100_002336 [Physocladia obscura]
MTMILINPPKSDSQDPRLIPAENHSTFIAADAAPWLAHIASNIIGIYQKDPNLLATKYLPPDALFSAVSVSLAAFPDNYKLFQCRPPVSGVDTILYGHPSKYKFRSPSDFLPHFIWLVKRTVNPNINCECKGCVRSISPTQINIPTATRSASLSVEIIEPNSTGGESSANNAESEASGASTIQAAPAKIGLSRIEVKNQMRAAYLEKQKRQKELAARRSANSRPIQIDIDTPEGLTGSVINSITSGNPIEISNAPVISAVINTAPNINPETISAGSNAAKNAAKIAPVNIPPIPSTLNFPFRSISPPSLPNNTTLAATSIPITSTVKINLPSASTITQKSSTPAINIPSIKRENTPPTVANISIKAYPSASTTIATPSSIEIKKTKSPEISKLSASPTYSTGSDLVIWISDCDDDDSIDVPGKPVVKSEIIEIESDSDEDIPLAILRKDSSKGSGAVSQILNKPSAYSVPTAVTRKRKQVSLSPSPPPPPPPRKITTRGELPTTKAKKILSQFQIASRSVSVESQLSQQFLSTFIKPETRPSDSAIKKRKSNMQISLNPKEYKIPKTENNPSPTNSEKTLAEKYVSNIVRTPIMPTESIYISRYSKSLSANQTPTITHNSATTSRASESVSKKIAEFAQAETVATYPAHGASDSNLTSPDSVSEKQPILKSFPATATLSRKQLSLLNEKPPTAALKTLGIGAVSLPTRSNLPQRVQSHPQISEKPADSFDSNTSPLPPTKKNLPQRIQSQPIPSSSLLPSNNVGSNSEKLLTAARPNPLALNEDETAAVLSIFEKMKASYKASEKLLEFFREDSENATLITTLSKIRRYIQKQYKAPPGVALHDLLQANNIYDTLEKLFGTGAKMLEYELQSKAGEKTESPLYSTTSSQPVEKTRPEPFILPSNSLRIDTLSSQASGSKTYSPTSQSASGFQLLTPEVTQSLTTTATESSESPQPSVSKAPSRIALLQENLSDVPKKDVPLETDEKRPSASPTPLLPSLEQNPLKSPEVTKIDKDVTPQKIQFAVETTSKLALPITPAANLGPQNVGLSTRDSAELIFGLRQSDTGVKAVIHDFGTGVDAIFGNNANDFMLNFAAEGTGVVFGSNSSDINLGGTGVSQFTGVSDYTGVSSKDFETTGVENKSSSAGLASNKLTHQSTASAPRAPSPTPISAAPVIIPTDQDFEALMNIFKAQKGDSKKPPPAVTPFKSAAKATTSTAIAQSFDVNEAVWVPAMIIPFSKDLRMTVRYIGDELSDIEDAVAPAFTEKKINLDQLSDGVVFWPGIVHKVKVDPYSLPLTPLTDNERIWTTPLIIDDLQYEGVAISLPADESYFKGYGPPKPRDEYIVLVDLIGFEGFPVLIESRMLVKFDAVTVSEDFILRKRDGEKLKDKKVWDEKIQFGMGNDSKSSYVFEKFIEALNVV